MELILWRHCDAVPGVPDERRPLTPLGMQDAARMARWLAARLPPDCRILVSPALRAQQTAQALGRAFDTDPALASGTGVDAVLATAGWPDALAPVLVVGHQPTLGRLASLLVDGEAVDRSLRAGEVLWLASRGAGDAAHAVLERSAAPDSV